MNVLEIRGYVLAVALIAPAASAIAVSQSEQDGPYTNSDPAVMANAQKEENSAALSARGEAGSAAAVAKFSTCGTLTFSSDGQDTAFSLNQFADPVLAGTPSFVCRTY